MMIQLLTSQYPGMRIWLSQRITALLMAIYTILLILALLIIRPHDYASWLSFASSWLFKIGTVLFFISLSVHAWVGMRDVLRDYLTNQFLRICLQLIVDFLLVAYLAWLFIILWGL